MSNFSVVLFLSFAVFCIYADHAVKVEKAEIETVDKDYLTIAVKVRQEGDKSLIDVDSDLLQDLNDDVFMQIHIEKKTNGAFSTLYKSEVINRCHFTDNRDKYPIEKALTDDFNKYGNLLQNCPIKKGHYYLKGFQFEPRDIIAEKIMSGEFCVHFLMMKEVNTQMKTLFSIKWYATV
ncbi:unnamed protein product [Hermetia illucens]|uniref:Uncharacterized protein n=2 Tax=Hermetia illucens TaxID=343691 RepID=A0A7R8UGT0_HERIL|nr:unnamed protein product [Hermetia illucens]